MTKKIISYMYIKYEKYVLPIFFIFLSLKTFFKLYIDD